MTRVLLFSVSVGRVAVADCVHYLHHIDVVHAA
jgi:hypothetical protein